jgi:hypothetical protein
MTLKEKFSDVQEAYHDRSDDCVLVADEFAIGFTEWCVKNELFYSIQYGRIETKSLLEIYKKEQGL